MFAFSLSFVSSFGAPLSTRGGGCSTSPYWFNLLAEWDCKFLCWSGQLWPFLLLFFAPYSSSLFLFSLSDFFKNRSSCSCFQWLLIAIKLKSKLLALPISICPSVHTSHSNLLNGLQCAMLGHICTDPNPGMHFLFGVPACPPAHRCPSDWKY